MSFEQILLYMNNILQVKYDNFKMVSGNKKLLYILKLNSYFFENLMTKYGKT